MFSMHWILSLNRWDALELTIYDCPCWAVYADTVSLLAVAYSSFLLNEVMVHLVHYCQHRLGLTFQSFKAIFSSSAQPGTFCILTICSVLSYNSFPGNMETFSFCLLYWTMVEILAGLHLSLSCPTVLHHRGECSALTEFSSGKQGYWLPLGLCCC